MVKKKRRFDRIMDPVQMLSNMDVFFHITRENDEQQKAVEIMKKLIVFMNEYDLFSKFSSPTELIINAVLCKKDSIFIVNSKVDQKIYDLIKELGYEKE